MTTPHILVVGRQPETAHSVGALISANSWAADMVPASAAEQRILRSPNPNLVVLEIGGEPGSLDILRRIRRLRPDLKIVVLCHCDDNRSLIEAIRIGAHDYLTSPYEYKELDRMLSRHLATSPDDNADGAWAEEVSGEHFFVANSPEMQKIRSQVEVLANIDVPILILGESGTGKEVIAHLIHKLSTRAKKRLLKVNCAALPSELLESELFGHERGAFSGAIRTKTGQFELCHQGTILLDEIAEMSASLQAKLLHVLQDKEFFRVGGESMIEVDVRVLAATNVNVQQAMAEHKFREDLYYRLSTFTISVPPLRERRDEIPILLTHFMQRAATQYGRPPLQLPSSLEDACLEYSWPGNVRELQNFVKRYLIMADENTAMMELRAPRQASVVVQAKSVPKLPISDPELDASKNGDNNLKCLVRSMKDKMEIEAITQALSETSWNRRKAAQLLHISYRGLLYKIERYSIPQPLRTRLDQVSDGTSIRDEISSTEELTPSVSISEAASMSQARASRSKRTDVR